MRRILIGIGAVVAGFYFVFHGTPVLGPDVLEIDWHALANFEWEMATVRRALIGGTVAVFGLVLVILEIMDLDG